MCFTGEAFGDHGSRDRPRLFDTHDSVVVSSNSHTPHGSKSLEGAVRFLIARRRRFVFAIEKSRQSRSLRSLFSMRLPLAS